MKSLRTGKLKAAPVILAISKVARQPTLTTIEKRVNTNPHILHFVIKRNKNFPNSKLPVLVYQKALDLPAQKHKASKMVQKIFLRNGWSNTWTNGIYDFHHYHSITHECMGVSTGHATVTLGGPKGRKIKLTAGDIIILPAGVAHKCFAHSPDFECIGAYPQGKDYDTNIGSAAEYKKAKINISRLSVPASDPLLGEHGFLKVYWKTGK